jgi:hypothetical protein
MRRVIEPVFCIRGIQEKKRENGKVYRNEQKINKKLFEVQQNQFAIGLMADTPV